MMPYVIVKALPRVCMKNTARGECRVVNTARGKAECCIYHEIPRVLCFLHTSIGSALNGILYLTSQLIRVVVM